MSTIRYDSDNGYTGFLYGKSSMSIGKMEGDEFHEILHTGSRVGEGYEYLKEQVDTFPELISRIEKQRIVIEHQYRNIYKNLTAPAEDK